MASQSYLIVGLVLAAVAAVREIPARLRGTRAAAPANADDMATPPAQIEPAAALTPGAP